MKIGSTLYIEFENNDQPFDRYRCKVIDQMPNYLIIDYPVHDRTRKSKFILKNTRFRVIYRVDETVYQFHSFVIKNIQGSLPSLAISLPRFEEHKRIQRRDSVRVETAVDVAIHCPNHSFSPFLTVTEDISAGGMSIYIHDHKFEQPKKVQVYIVLPMNNGIYHYISALASFVRYEQSKAGKPRTAGLMFTSLSRHDEQHIVQYCFEKQRDQRKKELNESIS